MALIVRYRLWTSAVRTFREHESLHQRLQRCAEWSLWFDRYDHNAFCGPASNPIRWSVPYLATYNLLNNQEV